MIITKETDYALRILRVLLDGEKHSVAEKIGRASCRERVCR